MNDPEMSTTSPAPTTQPSSCAPCSFLRSAMLRICGGHPNKVADDGATKKTVVLAEPVVFGHKIVIEQLKQEELEEQFRIVDINRDGFIDATELMTVMNNLGVKSTDEEIKIILEQADHNGSGKIEEEDFMHVMKEYTTDQDTLEARELFDVFDTDKDGFISRDELTFALSEVLRDDVSKKEIETMMKLACKNTTGKDEQVISFRDFQQLLLDVGFTTTN